jgi:hypothetical protein
MQYLSIFVKTQCSQDELNQQMTANNICSNGTASQTPAVCTVQPSKERPSMEGGTAISYEEKQDNVASEIITFGLAAHPTSRDNLKRQRYRAHYNFRTGLKIHHSIQHRHGIHLKVIDESDL